MDVFVELSLEHPTLPLAELEGVLALVGGTLMGAETGVALAQVPDADHARFLATRLGLAHSVSERWFTSEPDLPSLLASFEGRSVSGRSFAVRARRLAGQHPELAVDEIGREAGAILAATGSVDLRNPDAEVRVLISERAHAGIVLAQVDRTAFESRTGHNRPFFSPVTLHPTHARAMVNLAHVAAGDRVLDPFCGTGGIALEAGIVGAQVYASDFDPRMVAGTRDALEAFDVAGAVVEERDVGEAPEFAGTVDAVVTDPPWGRNAATQREALDALYQRFFAAAESALKPGGRLVASFADERHVAAGARVFDLESHHPVRVHRSLTRHVAVFRTPTSGQ